MFLARRRQRRKKELADLDLTTFLNMMVVLIAFLLVSAVFSRITIQELKLPSAAGRSTPDKPVITIEVIVRKAGLEISDGKRVVAAIPRSGGAYNLPKLSEYLQHLKEQYSEKTDATLLSEADIPYEDVITVMDAVKAARIKEPGKDEPKIVVLFPDLSIGDAP